MKKKQNYIIANRLVWIALIAMFVLTKYCDHNDCILDDKAKKVQAKQEQPSAAGRHELLRGVTAHTAGSASAAADAAVTNHVPLLGVDNLPEKMNREEMRKFVERLRDTRDIFGTLTWRPPFKDNFLLREGERYDSPQPLDELDEQMIDDLFDAPE